jgi:hypothetical protein
VSVSSTLSPRAVEPGTPVSPRPWTYKEMAHLRELRAAGMKITAIAKRLGRTKGSVNATLHRLGLCRPMKYPPGGLRWRVARLWKNGWADVEMADRLGVTAEAVRKARKAQGLPRNVTQQEISRQGNMARWATHNAAKAALKGGG